jgi:hypothetical protein
LGKGRFCETWRKLPLYFKFSIFNPIIAFSSQRSIELNNKGDTYLIRHAWVCLLVLLLSSPASADLVFGDLDLSGEWEIQEEDKSYKVTLDRQGNGAYTWQAGRIVTTYFSDRQWEGTWHQTGNDREGGFELLLSEDGAQAEGVWWYTRVGDQNNIPPRQWGGSYLWNRLTAVPTKGEGR